MTSCCTSNKHGELMEQHIIDGVVSDIKTYSTTNNGVVIEVTVYVQTTTSTESFTARNRYMKKWKIGDSCILVINKYKSK